ncbi:MAG TPA: hypothetical protein VNJ01_15825 [Bacteriovoracaceae bacterium]|nr:hypothetical protein [Bacteriovoracaceae bacterium]
MKKTLVASATLLMLVSSCAKFRKLERDLIGADEKDQVTDKPVSRGQYNQLLVKYEQLSQKYEELKENPNANKSSLVDELEKTQTENFANTSSDAPTETVDVFGAATEIPASTKVIEVPSDLESQLGLYRRGLALQSSNPGEATKIFQRLEIQGAPAVRVRAKFQVGELLFQKEQYDIALQVYEDIITGGAHSGVVLDALRRAVTCAAKLNIPNKKDQYSSMLNDVFETTDQGPL